VFFQSGKNDSKCGEGKTSHLTRPSYARKRTIGAATWESVAHGITISQGKGIKAEEEFKENNRSKNGQEAWDGQSGAQKRGKSGVTLQEP